jgi:hypothetical protein
MWDYFWLRIRMRCERYHPFGLSTRGHAGDESRLIDGLRPLTCCSMFPLVSVAS